MIRDKGLLREYRVKRMQRAIEYTLLFTFHLFFLLAFFESYRVVIAVTLCFVIFCMNFQLTQLRERQRLKPVDDRKRISADMFESIIFLLGIVLLSVGGFAESFFDFSRQEHLSYIASILCGIFLGGLVGEVWFQLRRLPKRSEEEQLNYVANLRRSIIFPFFSPRRLR